MRTLSFCCEECRYMHNNKEKRKIDKALKMINGFKYDIECNHEKCTNRVMSNAKRRKYCSKKCRLEQVEIDDKKARADLAIQKEEERKERLEREAKRRQAEAEKPIVRYKKPEKVKLDTYKCNGIGCNNRTWKRNGYCIDCQTKGKKIKYVDRNYRTGINCIDQRCGI